ncbi:transcriptional antiterminator/mannitol/fructose-specific phosphotransferase system IIA component (Ntr-type) [Clostridium algifaecis]|uniref:Transcriptional antiterminator/mannitol/fructose-specific phosphotransferase system IIA component (Ntr-type) n=1 Tax=Clostridium algifaecis TaxID=1472040 RepID=A0ABS4KRE6_9CLOT|nr:BglG family transcription antiterminator [Clostridium algifaecis]MBP2032611.1 transcriptional antiterminator/mannitol/fructose-specific phosphotransferase system IIA component (Ntr-type) [Clostridium algifaecis]
MIHFSHTKHGDELLNLLISADRYLSLQELQDRLKLSRRSVFYILKKVNAELEQDNLDHIQRIGTVGYYLTPDDIAQLNKKQYSSDFALKPKLNRLERDQFIIYKLINCERVSLLTITSALNISKNTAISSLKNVNLELKKYGLKLIKSKQGQKLEGSETSQRNWVYEQLSKHNSVIYSQLSNDPSKLSQINAYLHQLEKITGNYLTDDALMIISTFILWYLDRIKNSHKLSINIPENGSFEDSAGLKWTKEFLNKNGITNEGEAHYLVKMINSSQFSKVNQEDLTIKKLIPITRAIVDRFNQVAGVAIPPKNLEISLTTHLLSTYHRVKYNISYKHPNLKQIEVKYHQLFSLTRYSVYYFEKFISTHLSDDEIALIALYFGSELRKLEEKALKNEKPDVIVVCSSGIGTSIVLEQQLRSRYPSIKFSSPMSVLQYESSSLSGVKLVISTIDLLERKQIPVIQVTAIPDIPEWNSITQTLAKVGLNSGKKSQINIENLLDIISNYARIEDVNSLKKALESYFNQVKNGKKLNTENNIRLQDLLFESHIMLYKQKSSWDEAIQITYAPLIKENIVKYRYIDEIINLTKIHGPYMVLGKGIMLAHAKPSNGVNSLGICLALFKHAVDIPVLKDKGTAKVNLIIGLAPVDSVSHLTALSQLMNKIQDDNWIASVYKCTNETQLKELILFS